MSFQAYLDNIRTKTGKTPEQFKTLAAKAGVYKPDMKAADLVAWLKTDYDLGHGHAMAIWAVFKDKGWVETPKAKQSLVVACSTSRRYILGLNAGASETTA